MISNSIKNGFKTSINISLYSTYVLITTTRHFNFANSCDFNSKSPFVHIDSKIQILG